MERLVILGGGESGVGTAILGKKEGYEVFVSDFGKISNQYKEVLKKYEIDWEEETHTESLILNADLLMKSPGAWGHLAYEQQLLANKEADRAIWLWSNDYSKSKGLRNDMAGEMLFQWDS